MEFPIMQWSIAAIYRLIGESIIITRICMFLIGILASLGMFIIIQELFKNQLVSCLTTFVFTFSPLFYYYTMNPLPDMFALAFGLLSTGFFLRYLKNETVKSHLFLSGLFFSLSVLAKLPFIIFWHISNSNRFDEMEKLPHSKEK
ncbi:MAG: glycosyltransferase family 39 protein [Saprospiraceae bacterium]|nr:glycosyltransferase family 39 protein [Saprospiraceae bacterium]